MRAIISGGGTGGHIFPALAIAGALKEADPESEIIFVGALGRMEMEKVPAAGYKIYGLDIAGLKRSLSLDNLKLPLKYIKAIKQAKKIIRDFKPDVAIGVGGYCSAPLLYAAQSLGIPTLIQEQNGFAGVANKILGKRARKICVAFEGMERFFPSDRIVLTGNPIRSSIIPTTPALRSEALDFYGLSEGRRHLLVLGGSLGCRTLNQAMEAWIESGCPGGENVEVLWQCGKYYKASVDEFMKGRELKNIHYSDFISRMDLAYDAADVIITRSGASSVSEICAAGKAAIFVPSPNVTEDHQTVNAMALVNKGAGMIVRDAEAAEKLLPTALSLLEDKQRIISMECNALALGKPDAAKAIVREVYKLKTKN